ncbi:MAG: hypothetical protein ACTSR3_16925 [Candidatus Helarchaeota archaeon]
MLSSKNNEKTLDISQTVITWLDDLQSKMHIPKEVKNYLEDLKTIVKIKSNNYNN